MMEHKPDVRRVFMNYKKVSFEGFHTPLIDVAIAVGKIVGDRNVDGIQPMKNGWQIYVKTEADRTNLVSSGIDLAGKHISLDVKPFTVTSSNVKITVKDLPLHEVSNESCYSGITDQVQQHLDRWS